MDLPMAVFTASSSRWHFNTSITFLAKHALGSVEISQIEEEEEEKMVMMRDLEPVRKESGTAVPALHARHPPNPGCPCHLTVPCTASPQLSLLPWHKYTRTRHRLSSWSDHTASSSQK